ncbi:MAG: FixH family protein [Thermodesulfovibrionia bacterium]|nr:FixH family protein [Thermodesulfovibrionia bacterium]
MRRFIFFLVMALFLTATAEVFAHGKKAKPLPHFAEGITKVSDNGLFSIEIVLEPLKPKVGKNKIKVYLHDIDGKDLEGAKVEVKVWNKDKDILFKDKTKTMETADGEYIVSNVVYDAQGLYELRVKVTKSSESDKAIFDVEVK